MRFQKPGNKSRYPGLQRGMKLSLAANVLEPGAFNAKSQYFIPLFNKIPRWDEASNGGCNSGPTGHDFPDNSTQKLITGLNHCSLVWVIIQTMEPPMPFLIRFLRKIETWCIWKWGPILPRTWLKI
jgi:hypothetical protein